MLIKNIFRSKIIFKKENKADILLLDQNYALLNLPNKKVKIMILWVASYPKSGNTWIRALISTYFYSNEGQPHHLWFLWHLANKSVCTGGVIVSTVGRESYFNQIKFQIYQVFPSLKLVLV